MTVFYGTQMNKFRNNTPLKRPDAGDASGKLRVFNETVTLAAQTTSDTIEVARLPKGARVLYGILSTSVTLGTSTLAVGITGTTGKYRAAAVLTAVTPEVFGVNAGIGVALSAEEIVFLTIGTATLPGSGTLRVMLVYSVE